MAQVFISYSRKDKEFVQKLVAALVAEKREVWLDETKIEPTAEWLKEIFKNIEAADNFLFVISPDSVISIYARKEIDHAALNNKRMVPIFYRPVEDKDIPEAVAKFQRIDFTGSDGFDPKFAKVIQALDTDLDWKETHTRLLTRAKEWEPGKDSSFLLRGKDLREAEQWVANSAEKEPKPTALHSQYILASRQSATKTQRIIIGAVAIAFLIAIGLTIYAFIEKKTADANANEASKQKDTAIRNEARAREQEKIAKENEQRATEQESVAEEQTAAAQRNAQESKAREWVASALESLNEDPERSMFLAMQAVRASMRLGQPALPGAKDALHRAILSSQELLTLRGATGPVLGVAFSPDGKRLATASLDKGVTLWDATSGQQLVPFYTSRHHAFLAATSAAFSPDGTRLAAASNDEFVRIWDTMSGRVLRILSGNIGFWALAFSPDGNRLAAAGFDNTVRLWDLVSGGEILTLQGHSGRIFNLAFGPDGTRLATASADGTAKVWDTTTGRELLTFRGHSSEGYASDGSMWERRPAVLSVAFNPDGKRLATGSVWETKVWDGSTGQEFLTLTSRYGDVTSVAFSSDGLRLATSDDNTVNVWDTVSGQELLTLRGHSQKINCVAFSLDGKRLATASDDETTRIWDALPRQELRSPQNNEGTRGGVRFSPDGKRLVIAVGDTVKVWDLGTGRVLLTLRGDSKDVSGVVFDPDGKRLAAASADNTARVWDAVTGRRLLTFRGHQQEAQVQSLSFTPDGKRVVTATRRTVRVWDPITGDELQSLKLPARLDPFSDYYPWCCIAISSDGKRIAAGYERGWVTVWNIRTGGRGLSFHVTSQRGLGVDQSVRRLTFSPDGARLAVAINDDREASIWDPVKGRRLLTLTGHRGVVNDVAFSSDGKLLATASYDKTTKVWDALTGRELLTLAGHPAAVEYVTFSRDSKHLATSSSDGTYQIYALDIRELLDLARKRITRDLTPEECKRYFQSGTCPPLP